MQEEFLIGELVERASETLGTEVTVRTIRYYTSIGLLPDPVRQGSRYYYTREHLDRLILIDRLKRRYLPLQEIKHILEYASAADVHSLLEKQDELAKKPAQRPPAVKEHSSALDYTQSLLKQEGWNTEKGPIPTRGHHWSSIPSIDKHFEAQNRAESWQHIPIAPGVELNVREGLDPKKQALVDDLVRYGRKLLES